MIPPPLLMVGASFVFALMGACVKFAAVGTSTGELVFYRSAVGLVVMLGVLRRRR